MPNSNARPAILQMNTAGGWRNVIKLDFGHEAKARRAMKAAATLADIGGATARVVIDDGTQTVICHYAQADGWVSWPDRSPMEL
ncbi:MAG: hypothetical protein RLZZ182_1304 [Pseudomonadota bacterium]